MFVVGWLEVGEEGQEFVGRLVSADQPPQDAADPRTAPGRGERGLPRRRTAAGAVLAAGAARATRLAFPWIVLRRWWPAWSTAPPPRQLQALISSVAAGRGLHLYIPN